MMAKLGNIFQPKVSASIRDNLIASISVLWHNQKIRYLVVGGYNTAFGYGCFALLWWLFHQKLHYIILLLISHVLSVINAYLGHRKLVFRSNGQWFKEFLKFNVVYLASLIFNLIALPVLVSECNLHPLLGQAIVMVVTVILSYTMHNNVTFKRSAESNFKKSVHRKKTKKRNRRIIK